MINFLLYFVFGLIFLKFNWSSGASGISESTNVSADGSYEAVEVCCSSKSCTK